MSAKIEKAGPKMVSIRDLSGYQFEIPVYQRGFRWTWWQVKELMDDLYEFSKDADKSTYCLQNITVIKKVDSAGAEIYEVIDGQQRLTAIWILVMAYMDSKKYDNEPMPIYSLIYHEKEDLTKFVEEITCRIKAEPSCTDILKNCEDILENAALKSIDSSLIYDAFKFIVNDYRSKSDNKYSAVLNAIFNDEFQSGKKQISVIWNEIDPLGTDDGDKTKYAIDRFSNLNANKIPLTESELIKARFIDKLPSGKVQEFALQWEEMERGLGNEEFWNFISSGKDEETRTDILFRVHLDAEESVDTYRQHHLFRQISKDLTDADAEAAYDKWTQIVQIYDTLYDWYAKYDYYHLIGLIIAVEDKPASKIIKELYDDYKNTGKKEFKRLLRKRIRTEKCYETPFSTKNGEWNVREPGDILLQGGSDDEISYVRNKDLVKPILLLFNISLLVNAYVINRENAAERFSFKLYKSQSNPIEIEHINPQHLEGKKAGNTSYTDSEKRKWAQETIEIIENEDEKEALRKAVEAGEWKNRTLIEQIENAGQLHALSNLTLLDKNLNIRYGDRFFNEKRAHILAARFGNPISDCEAGDAEHNYYKQSVIFPGTMWVFMRQYHTADCQTDGANRWIAKDRKAYIDCMQKSIYTLLCDDKPKKNEQ